MTPAPTISPEAKPVDTIVGFLQQEASTPVELWKYCADEWRANYYAFDPENFFLEQGEPAVEEEIPDPDLEDDGDDDEDTVDDDIVPDDDASSEEITESRVITPEIKEQMILYAPLCQALKEFWSELLVFTTDNPAVANWDKMCANMDRFIAFVPLDRDRLIRHVRRIDQARQEAQALLPHTTGFQTNTVLLDILNNKFE